MTETITVNGATRPCEGETVHDLLAACGIDPDRPGIAVAINAGVAPRTAWATTRLKPGDRIDIVEAKAGG